MRILTVVSLALFLSLAFSACKPTPTSIADEPDAHWVRGVQSNRCLDIPNGTHEEQARVQLWDCTPGNRQQVVLITRQGDGYQLQFAHSRQCLEPAEDGQGDSKPLQQFPCNNSSKQHWTIEPNGGGYNIINALSGKCIDVADGAVGNSARVNQYRCLGQPNQQFNFEPKLPPPPVPPSPTPTPTPTPIPVPPVEKKKICFDQRIPTGWILINKYQEHLAGCDDNHKFNVWEIQRIDNRPSGEMLIACLGNVPPGWDILGKNIDKTRCGWISGTANNIMNIKKQ